MPIPVFARSKACVCGRQLLRIVGSNPAGGMNVCFECCVFKAEVSASGRSLIQRSPTDSGVWFWSLDNEEALAYLGCCDNKLSGPDFIIYLLCLLFCCLIGLLISECVRKRQLFSFSTVGFVSLSVNLPSLWVYNNLGLFNPSSKKPFSTGPSRITSSDKSSITTI